MVQRAMEKKRAGEGGFTLIELMIVIVILGILAAIVVFAVGGITDRGETSACKANVKTTEVAVEAYYAKVGSYATDIDDATHSATTLVGAGFLHSAPSGTGYTIGYTATATGFTVTPATCP